jgi:hypothetical protein
MLIAPIAVELGLSDVGPPSHGERKLDHRVIF